MKKLIATSVVLASLLIATTAFATFNAVGDVNINNVTFTGNLPVTMVIKNTSTSGSINYNAGVFTVTNPGAFNVTCATSTATAMKAVGPSNVCVINTTPGVTTLTLPTTAGVYTVSPSDAVVPNALSLNSECGAATCEAGYTLRGTGATAYCLRISTGGGGGGGYYDQTPAPEVCEVYDPTTGVTRPCSTEEETTIEEDAGEEALDGVSTIPGVPALDANGNVTVPQMLYEAGVIFTGDVNKVVNAMGVARDLALETGYTDILNRVVGDTVVDPATKNAILYFITYGTPSTKDLGAGERAGVVNSFKAAFGRLPVTQADWEDVIKIANGRWPSQRSQTAENNASAMFKKIYLRDPNMGNPNDNAAVTVMAYGLRPANRNLASEKAAILIYKAIFKRNPAGATDWDAVRAIAYSGSKR